MDSACEQEKLEAGKLLKNAEESHLSSARFVAFFIAQDLFVDPLHP